MTTTDKQYLVYRKACDLARDWRFGRTAQVLAELSALTGACALAVAAHMTMILPIQDADRLTDALEALVTGE